jgi:hypothetical protein
MAFMRKGLMGGFTGKFGNQSGYLYRGKTMVRSLPGKRKGPPTTAQIIQREKFALVSKFLQPVGSFMTQVHKKAFKVMTGYNKLFSLNIQEIVTGEYPDFRIDFSKVLLTRGSLSNVRGVMITPLRTGYLVFRWRDDSGCGNALASDKLYMTFYQ